MYTNVHISVGTQCQQPVQFINIMILQVLKTQCIYFYVEEIMTRASNKKVYIVVIFCTFT